MATTITAFYSFTPDTVIRSSEVNNNFDVFRGSIIPVNESTATAGTAGAYNLGTSEYHWLGGYFANAFLNTYDTTTSAPTPAAGFASIYAKDDDKIYSKNSSGTETQITPTTTSNTIHVFGQGTAGQSLTADATNVPFTEVTDSNAAWNGSRFDAPTTAFYMFNGCLRTALTSTGFLSVFIDGTQQQIVSGSSRGDIFFYFNWQGTLTSGQSWAVRLSTNNTAYNGGSNSISSYISIRSL